MHNYSTRATLSLLYSTRATLSLLARLQPCVQHPHLAATPSSSQRHSTAKRLFRSRVQERHQCTALIERHTLAQQRTSWLCGYVVRY